VRARSRIRSSASSERKQSAWSRRTSERYARICDPVGVASSQRALRTTSEKDSRSDRLAFHAETMSPREHVRAALRREEPDRVVRYVDRVPKEHWTERDVARELRNSDE
jgi:hypothetical protein